MTERRRTWLRWIGTIAGVVLVAFGVRELSETAVACTPHQTGYSCATSQSHPHVALGLLIAVAGLVILFGSRHYFSYFG